MQIDRRRKIVSVADFVVFGLVLVFFFSTDLQAQYNSEAGIRVGGTTGITGKLFFTQTKAVEGIIGTFGNGFSITGLVEQYVPAFETNGLYLYFGGGAHTAFYNGQRKQYSNFGREVEYHHNNDVGFGVNGIVGLEYWMPNHIPIAFSVDLKPFIEVGSGGYVSLAPDPSVGVKFLFVKPRR